MTSMPPLQDGELAFQLRQLFGHEPPGPASLQLPSQQLGQPSGVAAVIDLRWEEPELARPGPLRRLAPLLDLLPDAALSALPLALMLSLGLLVALSLLAYVDAGSTPQLAGMQRAACLPWGWLDPAPWPCQPR